MKNEETGCGRMEVDMMGFLVDTLAGKSAVIHVGMNRGECPAKVKRAAMEDLGAGVELPSEA